MHAVSRLAVCLVAVTSVLALAAAVAVAAPQAPPLVVFHAPANAPAEVIAARDALAALARREGAAWIDLTPAPPAAPSAPALLRRAVDAYEALRYDDAFAGLDQALAEAEQTGAAGLDAADLSDLLLYRALVYTQRGDQTRAWEDMVRAAVADPTRVLDPLRFPPKSVEAYQKAVKHLDKLARAKLAVVAPAGCDVLVDGRRVSDPIPPLPLGEHYLRVVCAGSRPVGVKRVLSADDQYTPPLVAEAPPADAEVLALAQARGARTVVVAAVSLSAADRAPPTLWLRLIDASSGVAIAQAAVSIAPGGAATADAEGAAEQLIARATGRTPEPAPKIVVRPGNPRPAPWYRSPWLWGAVGAAVATAVILPLALDDGTAGSAVIKLDGTRPW